MEQPKFFNPESYIMVQYEKACPHSPDCIQEFVHSWNHIIWPIKNMITWWRTIKEITEIATFGSRSSYPPTKCRSWRTCELGSLILSYFLYMSIYYEFKELVEIYFTAENDHCDYESREILKDYLKDFPKQTSLRPFLKLQVNWLKTYHMKAWQHIHQQNKLQGWAKETKPYR